MMNYIGLDAHSKTCSLVCLDESDKIIRKAHLETTESQLLSFLRSVAGPKKLVLEESGLSQWLFMLLKDQVDELVVCNPLYLSRNPKAKTDFNDALHLARELKCGHVVSVHHEDSDLMRMRSLISGYQDTVNAMTRAKNQFKAILRKEAINIKTTTVYFDQDIFEKLSNPSDRFVAKGLQDIIVSLDALNLRYQAEFIKNGKQNEVLKLLMSIPGIAHVRAHVIASAICSAERFPNKYKLWSYAMLVRHQDQSGGVVLSNRKNMHDQILKESLWRRLLRSYKGKAVLRNITSTFD